MSFITLVPDAAGSFFLAAQLGDNVTFNFEGTEIVPENFTSLILTEKVTEDSLTCLAATFQKE